ncbi:hypothetical protein AB0F81_21125 [Actinoplanes sp. NPDC024001]|uniref:hypothetical protein n=1 Tax=Actinoplanes sp. NPDC024001 TaxID=3154598 RepID=UPI0034021217
MNRRSVVPAALLLAFLAGCANNNTVDPGAPAPATSPSAVPSVPPTEAAPTKPAPAGGTTVTGTVTAGVEPGCLLLTGSGVEHLLIFEDDTMEKSVKVGSTVTVTGRPESGMMTTCMQGEPFVVTSVAAN